MGRGWDIVRRLASAEGLFRERDLEEKGISSSCLRHGVMLYVKPHGYGVWSARNYEPTRYELLQIRVEDAVFWGPSALWLLGVTKQEPPELWIAIGHKSRRPRNLALDTVIVRSRNLEKDVEMVPHGVTPLRVHSRARAEADLARSDCIELLDRTLASCRFILAPWANLLCERLRPSPNWKPPCAPPYECAEPEEWSVVRSIPSSVPKPRLGYRPKRR